MMVQNLYCKFYTECKVGVVSCSFRDGVHERSVREWTQKRKETDMTVINLTIYIASKI